MAVEKGYNIKKYYKSKHTSEYKKIWDSKAKQKVTMKHKLHFEWHIYLSTEKISS